MLYGVLKNETRLYSDTSPEVDIHLLVQTKRLLKTEPERSEAKTVSQG
jgi:hypothetical protein